MTHETPEEILRRIFAEPVYKPAAQWEWIFGWAEQHLTAAIFGHPYTAGPLEVETEQDCAARLSGLLRLASELGFQSEANTYLSTLAATHPTEFARLKKHTPK